MTSQVMVESHAGIVKARTLMDTGSSNWKHLEGPSLADPDYDKTGRIDILLGAGIFVEAICQGRWSGPRGSPTALNTHLDGS